MNNIKAARQAAELTQEKMSELFGIPRRTIEDWDSGKRNPPEWVERLIVDKLRTISYDNEIVVYGDGETAEIVGNGGMAIAGNRGHAISEFHSVAIAADSGVATAKDLSIAVSGYKGASETGDSGVSLSGIEGKAVTADAGVSVAGKSGIAITGNYGSASTPAYGESAAGMYGIAVAGDYGTAKSGNDGISVTGELGYSISENKGIAVSRHTASTGVDGMAIAKGIGAKVKGGMGAVIIIMITMENWKSAVVDGEKIKADTWYRLENGEFVEEN